MTISCAILAVLVLLLAGCGRNRASATATATNPPAPRGPAATTAAHTPAPPVSATPARRTVPAPPPLETEDSFATMPPLQQAAWLHQVGDYAQEQRLLLALLDDADAAIDQQQESLYRLALARLAAGQPALALDALEKFSLHADSLPAEDPRRINTVFLRAEALAALGRNAEAAAAYGAFLEQRPQLTGPVEEIIAAAWLAAGEWSRAANALRRALLMATDNGEKTRLLERLAAVFEADERWNAAAFVYDEILAVDFEDEGGNYAGFDDILGYRGSPVYRTGILYRAGAAYATAGEEETAISRWRLALAEAPRSNAAYQSLIQLVNREIPVDPFLRGEIDLFAGAYIPAIQAFERFLEQSPQDDHAAQAWLGIAQSHLGLGQWEDARLALDHLLEAYPTCPCLGDAWLTRSRLLIAQGAPAQARRIYRTFARERPDDPLAAEALWLSAISSIDADNQLGDGPVRHAGVTADPVDEAMADLLRLVDAHPHSDRAPDSLLLLGISAFAHSRYAQAANNFERLLTDYPDQAPAAATYWLGRARYAQGEHSAARSLWRALAAREPETLHGLLAAVAHGSGPGEPGQNVLHRLGVVAAAAQPLPDDDGSRAFAENWLTAAWQKPVSLTNLPQAVTDDPDLAAAELLFAFERRAEGLKLLERVYWRYHDDPAALAPLIFRFDSLGANRLSISAAIRMIRRSPASRTAAAPLFLQRIAYPRHFSWLVEKETAAFRIPPLLFYSLIRQESLFEYAIQSSAGAQGLTQIIPSTGAEIAERLNYPDYNPALLNRPFINIRFGAFYLRWVQDYTRDSLLAALAGYNAGPGNARNWLDRAAPDDALFIEYIPYTETRLYLHRLLTYYYHYLRLYSR